MSKLSTVGRHRGTFLVGALIAALLWIAAGAASVHYKQNRPPTFTDQGLTLSCRGALSGLGNGDICIELTATGIPVSTCTNPAGATQPPGQNPAEVTLTGVQVIPASEVKNGNVTFNVGTGAPVTPIPGAPGCPNTKWTQDITDVEFTSATLTVHQPGVVVDGVCTGPVVLDDDFNF